MRQTETKRQRVRYAEIRSRKIKHTNSTWTLSDIITNSFSRNLHWISTYVHTAYTYQFYSWKLIMVRVVKLISISSTLPMNSFHPSIHPSVYFADKYKQINIKVHLQGEWKKRGDSLLSPLTHNIQGGPKKPDCFWMWITFSVYDAEKCSIHQFVRILT